MRTNVILLLILFTCAAGTGQTRKISPMPQVQTIGEGQLWRISDKKDKNGRSIPPWKDVTIANVFGFKKKPVVGDMVTIVPLDVRLAPFDLKIVETKAGVNCDGETDSKNDWWEVKLEQITDKRLFEIAPKPNRAEEIPFDVCVIYPSVKSARQLTRNVLGNNMLPQGINLNIIKAAIDLTNDEIPDVLLVEYCCLNPKKPVGGACEYTCGKTYKKVRNIWKLVDTSTPC